MGSSDENFGPARFFDEKLAQFKGRWERLPRPESREPLSGGGCRHFAVLIRKIGLLLKVFSKNQMVFTKEGEEFHETRGFETKNSGYLQPLGRNLATVLMK